MDVSRDRFVTDVFKIIEEIADSHFVAFDLEFSGVAGRTARLTPGKPSLQDVYEETKIAAEKYEVLQFGITIVHEDVANGRYVVKPYNFNITQIPTLHERIFKRTWSMNSGAVGFLLRNGFDFGKQISQGIHYLSRIEEEQVRKTLTQNEKVKRPDIVLKPEDDILIDHIRSSVKRWLATSEGERESFLNIPSDIRAKRVPGTLNRYQVRLTHQIVQNEFPTLRTQGMNHFVQITNPSDKALREKKETEEKAVNREIARAVGFRWLLEAIAGSDIRSLPDGYLRNAYGNGEIESKAEECQARDRFQYRLDEVNDKLKNRRKILVGHNCFTDLVNLHRFMMGWLPESVEEFTESLRKTFPAIIDTKHIASMGSARWGDTSLAKVEEDLRTETAPQLVIASDFDRYKLEDFEHEAGYDSLLTAKIAIRGSIKMEREGAYRQEQLNPPAYVSIGTAYLGVEEGYATAQEVPAGSTDIADIADIAEGTTGSDVVREASEESVSLMSTNQAHAEVIAVKQIRLATDTHDQAAKTDHVSRASIAGSLQDASNVQPVGDSESTGHQSRSTSLHEPGQKQFQSVDHSHPELQAMVQNGVLMPRWDSDLWAMFGNRLQVNGSQEGICIL